MVNHHSLKFGGHKRCGSGYTMVLVCHMFLQKPFMVSQKTAKIGGHRHCGNRDIMLLVVEE